MKRNLLVGLFVLLLPVLAFADETTVNLGLTKPTAVPGSWGTQVNTNFDIIDAEFANDAHPVQSMICSASDRVSQIVDGVVTCAAGGGGGGSNIVLDLGDDGGNDSVALGEIATVGDANGIFTEPGADKLLIDLTKDWPKADLADALAANGTNCSGSIPRGIDAAGNAEGCADVDLTTEVTGVLPLANGGLASGTAAGGRTTLSVPSFAEIQSGALVFCNDGGANDTYTCTGGTPSITAYTNGMVVLFRPNTSNTGAATLNINSLGAKDIRRSDGSTVLLDDDLLAGRRYWLNYDGTLFRMGQGDQGGGSFLPLSGGTLTGQLITDNLGIEFEESDVNPTCGAGNYNIYADASETKLKKCMDGSITDLAPAEIDTQLSTFQRGKQITSGANSFANRWGAGDGGAGCGIYVDGTLGPQFVCWPASGIENDLDHIQRLNAGKKFSILNSAAIEKFTLSESTGAITNINIDAEATGNTITIPVYIVFLAAACDNATATSGLDLPTSGVPTPTCFGTTTTVGTLSFADGATSTATTHWRLPADLTGTMDIDLVWFANAASANAVRWSVATGCVANGEAINAGPSYNAASSTNANYTGTANQRTTTSFVNVSITNCAASETIYLRVQRIGADAGDTLVSAAELVEVGVKLRRAL